MKGPMSGLNWHERLRDKYDQRGPKLRKPYRSYKTVSYETNWATDSYGRPFMTTSPVMEEVVTYRRTTPRAVEMLRAARRERKHERMVRKLTHELEMQTKFNLPLEHWLEEQRA
jgi:hypothetical protein